jgi:hypothetical protein
MNISDDISKQIAKLIHDYIAEGGPDPNNLRQLAAHEMVLPLTCDWGGVFTINVNGDIISFPFSVNDNGDYIAFPFDDEVEGARLESDPRIRNVVLFGGSKKYPELKNLIVKPDNARVCPDCGGTGISPYAEKLNTDAIACYCGGLGWLP